MIKAYASEVASISIVLDKEYCYYDVSHFYLLLNSYESSYNNKDIADHLLNVDCSTTIYYL